MKAREEIERARLPLAEAGPRSTATVVTVATVLFVATVLAVLVLAFRTDDAPAPGPAPVPAPPPVTVEYYGAPAD